MRQGHRTRSCSPQALLFIWGITGPIFHFGDTWQLVINTGTTIVTFLMVFLIQNTQNRDSAALQIKVDELIRAVKGAQNALLDLEELEDDQLEVLRQRYERLANRARKGLAQDLNEGETASDNDDQKSSYEKADETTVYVCV